MKIVCTPATPFAANAPSLIELSDGVLAAKCRPINLWGIFNPKRWVQFNVNELSGVWVGRVGLVPPTFWMFESNALYLKDILVIASRTHRSQYYVREFHSLTHTGALLKSLLDLGVRCFVDQPFPSTLRSSVGKH